MVGEWSWVSSWRRLYRLVRAVAALYGIWVTFRKSRWLAVGLALWRLLQRKPARDARRMAAFTFIHAGEPAVYRRRGWRRVVVRRIKVPRQP